jgi:formiminotetrahydrofolate cyclodeaminase
VPGQPPAASQSPATGQAAPEGRPAGSLLDQPVGDFLDLVAARVPAPGGGGAAAVTGALAAALTAMAARFSSSQLPAAAGIAEQADRLRGRAAGLADLDATAYRAVLDAYALPRDGGAGDRRQRIREALHGAATVPLEIAEIAARVSGLAAEVAAGGNPNLRGDTVAAAHLAEASARSAAALVDINVSLGGLPAVLSRRAAAAVAAAHSVAVQVSAAPS